MTVIGVIVALIVAVAAAAAGYFIGYNNRKKTAEAQIGSAEAEATRLVNEAIKTADQKRLSTGGRQGALRLLRRRGGGTLRRLRQVRKALSRRLH